MEYAKKTKKRAGAELVLFFIMFETQGSGVIFSSSAAEQWPFSETEGLAARLETLAGSASHAPDAFCLEREQQIWRLCTGKKTVILRVTPAAAGAFCGAVYSAHRKLPFTGGERLEEILEEICRASFQSTEEPNEL